MPKGYKGREKSERLHMLIAPDELAAIDDWRFKNRIATRAEAIRRLAQIALTLEPGVVDLNALWLETEAAREQTESFIDAKRTEAEDRLVGLIFRIGQRAGGMSDVYDAMKSGKTFEIGSSDMTKRLEEREKTIQLLKKIWERKI
jgi:hypothetical protein